MELRFVLRSVLLVLLLVLLEIMVLRLEILLLLLIVLLLHMSDPLSLIHESSLPGGVSTCWPRGLAGRHPSTVDRLLILGLTGCGEIAILIAW